MTHNAKSTGPGHSSGHHHGPEHHHHHRTDPRGAIKEIFAPHSHDAADSLDGALESSAAGIRAVKISPVALGAISIAQLTIVAVSGSIALLADTIHNFSDTLTAIPRPSLAGRNAANAPAEHSRCLI